VGFTIYYRSTRRLSPAKTNAIKRATDELCAGRTWLSCEPVCFFQDQKDGRLFGGSKPNFQPHPDDVAAAARDALPDGTVRDVIEILCRLSSDYEVDWDSVTIMIEAQSDSFGAGYASPDCGNNWSVSAILAEFRRN
jgi:hypothetical protein